MESSRSSDGGQVRGGGLGSEGEGSKKDGGRRGRPTEPSVEINVIIIFMYSTPRRKRELSRERLGVGESVKQSALSCPASATV